MQTNQSFRTYFWSAFDSKRVRALCYCLTASCILLGTPLTADDTEIFVGSGSNITGVKPNVLFILDNSGSMDGVAYDSNGQALPLSRMENMKLAFEDVMKNANGINVGLMSYNGSNGGFIVYPVENIDKELTTEATLESNIGMTSGADDAVEIIGSGNVYVDDDTLTLAHTSNREASGAGESIVAFLQHENDDGEQNTNGNMIYTGHYQFNMQQGQHLGLRYSDLDIPQGAQIISARLEFTASRNDSSHIHMRIWGENADNPNQFGTSFNDITNRLNNKTISFVDWEMTGFEPWSNDQKYDSPDISPILQEIINRPDWDPADAMVLLFEYVTGTGHRAGTLRREDVSNTQGLTGKATLLHVTWSTGVNLTTDQIVGLRFDNIDIPTGATVTNARIDFVSANANTTPDNLKIQVQVQNSGNALPFTATRNNISNRTKFSDVVTWHPDDDWNFNQTVAGPNVTHLVQRVVNNASGWCGGNAMAFFLKPSTNADIMNRLAYAYEAGVGKKPTLTVSYTGGANGCSQRNWSSRISGTENDAMQNGKNGNANNTQNIINFNAGNFIGLRFEKLPVQPGKQVIEAYIEFTAAGNNTGANIMSIKGQAVDNAPAFPQTKRNISNRQTTTSNVSWSLENWETDVTYRSPDISAVVNEILARPGWKYGHSLALILTTSTNNNRNFWSYDGNTGKAARLVIRAESGGIPSNINTVRWHEIGLVNDLKSRGMTPNAGALFEAAQYFTGNEVSYGSNRLSDRYGRISHTDSWTGGTVSRNANCNNNDLDNQNCASERIDGAPRYISPITSACQTSHVVLLTDGSSNSNNATSRIANLIGDTGCSNDTSISGEKCARSLARWMANTDLMPSISDSVNTVKTHTVAFNLGSTNAVRFLEDLAREGQGGFYNVNSAQDLTTAFDSILQSVRSTAATFVAPGATVNQFNRLSHRAEVYFSVFRPDSAPRWAGNLKRYKLLGNPAVISDANDKAAVDSTTGFFKEDAQSVWSPAPDGSIVTAGGAASQRPVNPDHLNIYTWFNGSSKDLTLAVNKVHENNSLITSAKLNLANTSDRNETLQWIRGVDVLDYNLNGVTNETRLQYEDPLHSIPQIITYGGTDSNPITAVYFGTNGGYLHAIDGSTGEELFSFVPESQLPLMRTRFNNTDLFTHPYGVDGSPTSWVHDANGDNQIVPSSGDFAYLYFGLRRGGNEYFALDVSNRKKPKIMWHIEGGSGDFAQLGQSWSTPVFARIQHGEDIKDVLIFGGGYDTAYDSPTFTGSTSTGNAIYVVDAITGQRLWYASSDANSSYGQRMSELQYPIPSDISAIDINGDGLVDQLYAADLGGQILRFDINALATGSNWIQGGVIAKLATNATPNNRRFFNAPDVSLTNIAGQQKLAIAIGSGSRPNPLSRVVQDRFYVILQDDVFRAPNTYSAVTHTNLVNQSLSITDLTSNDSGWFFNLPNSGEKVLSSSVTLAGKIVMTSYSPDASASSCNPIVGTGRAYVLNLLSSRAVADLDEDGTVEDTQDRSKELSSGNIPPSPKVLFPEEGAPTVLIGPEQPLEKVDFGLANDWTQIYRRPEDPN